jgi:hypothetical protein
MVSTMDGKKNRLRKALKMVYRQKEAAQVHERWELSVMTRIRGLASAHRAPGYLERFEPFVWRLAPAACILVIVLAVAVTQLDGALHVETVQLLAEDPADFSLLSLLSS